MLAIFLVFLSILGDMYVPTLLLARIKEKLNLSKIALEGMIEGKRSRGRQRKRWRDNVHEWSGCNINELNTITQDRSYWRGLSHV